MTEAAVDVKQPKSKPAWRSKILMLFVLITLAGLGLLAYAKATAPKPTASGAAGDLVRSLNGDSGGAVDGAIDAGKRWVDKASPALTKFGASFVGGFALGFGLKKFIRMTLLIAAAIAIGIFVLKKTGVINLDWNSVQSSVDHGLDEAAETATRNKDLLLGYLPSSISGGAGVLYGLLKG